MDLRSITQGFLRYFGYEVRRSQPDIIQFLKSREIDVVFDVGANEGQFGLWLRRKGYDGTIISFEPLEPAFRILARHAQCDGNWIAHQVALSDATGEALLNVSEFSVFSSFLPVRGLALAIDGRSRVSDVRSVPMKTLDAFTGEFRERNCFLKVDTQGSERSVVRGATRSIETMRGVQLELSFAPLYEGEWPVFEALQTMRALGYVPAQVHPVLCHPLDAQVWVQADFVFRRLDEAIDGPPSSASGGSVHS